MLSTMPAVTMRKSRYSYGVLVEIPIDILADFDAAVDAVVVNAEGKRVTKRMRWYLLKVCAWPISWIDSRTELTTSP
jgi:hypothetical protein